MVDDIWLEEDEGEVELVVEWIEEDDDICEDVWDDVMFKVEYLFENEEYGVIFIWEFI